MRQVGDTLVWLGLIAVLVAVLYFTPHFANYFSAREQDSAGAVHGRMTFRANANPGFSPSVDHR